MSFIKVIGWCMVIGAISFASPVDTTIKTIGPQPVISTNSPVIATKTDLKNQKKITRPNTTWSKIKDLFM